MDISLTDHDDYENSLLFFKDYFNYILYYLKDCAPSVVSQVILSNYKGILICFIINLITTCLQLIKGIQFFKDILICCLNSIGGIYLLLDTFESGTGSILLFGLTAVCVIGAAQGKSSCLLSVLALSAIYIVFNEFHVDPVKWHSLRGPFMILLMKIISISIDIDRASLQGVPAVKLVGYLLTPCSILYGPWFDYRLYDRWSRCSLNFSATAIYRSILLTVKNFGLGLICLLFSTCGSQFIFSALPQSKWVRAYQDAQSFRFSHYFISFLSIGYMNSVGLSDDDNGGDHKKNKIDFKFQPIVHPLSIEIPRSLIDVVTLWNLPMHFWLKNYVFFPCRRFGRFFAILLTFVASSLLHGFNFALSAILISLGVYSYVEYVLRSQLAKTTNSCIKARPCHDSCSHKFKKYHIISLFFNITFTLMGMVFLAYIAAMFDDSVGHSQGYSMKHSIECWRRLKFAGHIMLLIGYVIYLAVKYFAP